MLLSDVAHVRHLEVKCTRCPRHGKLLVAGLLERFGPDAALPEVLRSLAEDCPQHQSPNLAHQCDVMSPTLSKISPRPDR